MRKKLMWFLFGVGVNAAIHEVRFVVAQYNTGVDYKRQVKRALGESNY